MQYFQLYPLVRRLVSCVPGCMLLCFVVQTVPTSFAADLYKTNESGANQSLIADRRANRVGDIITILVMENSSASNSADTSTNTNFGLNAKVGTMFAGNNSLQLGAGDSYGGKGQLQRSGRLLAQISATVTEVLPNGDLVVAGEQTIDMNNEKTHIRLQGHVRQLDIAQNNSVQSNRLADAKIDYVGEGFLTDRSKPGLIPRLFAWLGLW